MYYFAALINTHLFLRVHFAQILGIINVKEHLEIVRNIQIDFRSIQTFQSFRYDYSKKVKCNREREKVSFFLVIDKI